MGRLRQFDTQEALEAATRIFWEKGFHATTMNDLLAEMGIQKGSLYKAFQDKRSLFRQVLDRYHDNIRQQMRTLLVTPKSSREGLKCWLIGILKHCRGKSGRKGCLSVNTMIELAPHDSTIKKMLQAHEKSVKRMLVQAIDAGKKSKEFNQDLNARLAARFLVNAANGFYVASKTARPGKESDRLVDFILASLR